MLKFYELLKILLTFFILKDLWDIIFFFHFKFFSWFFVSLHPFLQQRQADKLPRFCVISTEKWNYLFTTFLVNEEKVQTGTVKWPCCLGTDIFLSLIGILCNLLHEVNRRFKSEILTKKFTFDGMKYSEYITWKERSNPKTKKRLTPFKLYLEIENDCSFLRMLCYCIS